MSQNLTKADMASKVASVVLHPLLMPLYCALLILYTPTPYAGLPVSVNAYLLGLVGLFGSLMPLIIIEAFFLFGMVSGLEMPTRRERVLPLLVTALAQGCAAAFMAGLLPAPLLGVVMGEAAILLVAALWSLFWKVSIHAMGAGGLLAVVTVVGMTYGQDFTLGAAAAFIWAGVMAWTRLHEKAHTPWQLLAGYAAGLALMGAVMTLVVIWRF